MSTSNNITRLCLKNTYGQRAISVNDLLNIDNIYFEQIIHRIHAAELLLNKASYSDTEAPFLDLNLSILSNGKFSTKIW